MSLFPESQAVELLCYSLFILLTSICIFIFIFILLTSIQSKMTALNT